MLGAVWFVVDAMNPYTPDPIVLWRALVLAILFFSIFRMHQDQAATLIFAGIETFVPPRLRKSPHKSAESADSLSLRI
jgi:hypothetical protein